MTPDEKFAASDRGTVIAVVAGVIGQVTAWAAYYYCSYWGLIPAGWTGWIGWACGLGFIVPLFLALFFFRRKRLSWSGIAGGAMSKLREFKALPVREKIALAVATPMLCVFGYGMALYPDAPIKPCPGVLGYCGKGGIPHTEAQYNAFQFWQSTLAVVWISGCIFLVMLRLTKKQDTKPPSD